MQWIIILQSVFVWRASADSTSELISDYYILRTGGAGNWNCTNVLFEPNLLNKAFFNKESWKLACNDWPCDDDTRLPVAQQQQKSAEEKIDRYKQRNNEVNQLKVIVK